MSLYQKYRPKVFEDVLTQSHVVEILRNSVKKNDIGHAYLFVGTRGCGKTSIARILARSINCQNEDYLASHGNPCNSCSSCIAALNNSNPDIIEMDAASNRGIEEIRTLKDSINFLPSFSRKKVYIIDEVHMMTKEAFNALLKTLEEPPEYVTFILCTTELHKVPLTIISRTQVFEFKPATDTDLFNKIKKILELENKFIPDDGINLIVKLAKGSFRDAESILDKVLREDTDSISYDRLLQILGYSSIENVKHFKNLLYKKDFEGFVNFANEILIEGNVLSFNYQLSQDIYDDIISSVNDVDLFYKLELFSFLAKLERDIKSSFTQKNIYIVRILKFLKRKNKKNIRKTQNSFVNIDHIDFKSNNVTAVKSSAKNNVVQDNVNNIDTNVDKLNKSLDISDSTNSNVSTTKIKDEDINNLKKKLLEILKSKNLFLYKIFTEINFDFNTVGDIIVEVTKKEHLTLLNSVNFKNLIHEFSKLQNHKFNVVINNKSNYDLDNKDDKTKKRISDLTDEEIIDLFNE